MKTARKLLVAVASVAVLATGGCSSENAQETESGSAVETSDTLAETIADASELGTVAQSLKEAGLAQVFDGAGYYTVLAPSDAAFDQVSANVDLDDAEQRPVLVAILRDHILPGYLTPEDIASAIDADGGSVEVETMGNHKLRFAKSGDDLTVTSEDGITATLGKAVLASNGVAISLDTVLKNLAPSN